MHFCSFRFENLKVGVLDFVITYSVFVKVGMNQSLCFLYRHLFLLLFYFILIYGFVSYANGSLSVGAQFHHAKLGFQFVLPWVLDSMDVFGLKATNSTSKDVVCNGRLGYIINAQGLG